MSWVTPWSLDDEFGQNGISIHEAIRLFNEMTLGWQLEIAQRLCSGEAKWMRHSGFAVLQIVLSYFETVGKLKCLRRGNPLVKRGGGEYFFAGVLDVLPPMRLMDNDALNEALAILYVCARCALYHGGGPGSQVVISYEFALPLQYERGSHSLGIHPGRLVLAMKEHLHDYVLSLKDPSTRNEALRSSFMREFNHMRAVDPLSIQEGEACESGHEEPRA